MGAPLTKTPATEAKTLVRDRLVERYGSLHDAAKAADPPMREQTLRHWIYDSPTSMSLKTERAMKSIGVKRSELISL